MQLHWIDYTIILIYFAFVLGIGVVLKRYAKTSSDFFLSGRSIPAWITGLAFISANLGAQEVIGMGASGANTASRRRTSTGLAPSRPWSSSGCSCCRSTTARARGPSPNT